MRKSSKIAWWSVGVLVVVLVGARIAAPHLILDYVNKTLDGLEGYSGRVQDIDLYLVKGEYEIEGIRIVKTDGKVPEPFIDCRAMDISVQWDALLDGSIVAEIGLNAPKVNFVAAPSEAESQTDASPNWREQVKELVPLRINHVRVRDGEVHFRNFHSDPKIDIYVQNVKLRVSNLTNSKDLSRTLEATAEGSGLAMGSGNLSFKGRIDPYAELPTFDIKAQLEALKIVELNEFLRAYANVDAERGRFSVYVEASAKNGRFDGYAKPFIKDLKVLKWGQEEEGVFGKLWEGVVGAASEIIENPGEETVATRIPFSGRVQSPDTDIWTTIGVVLRHGFIEALSRGIEGAGGLETAAKQGKGGETEG